MMDTYQINNQNLAVINKKFSTVYMQIQDRCEPQKYQKLRRWQPRKQKMFLLSGNQHQFRVFIRTRPLEWLAYQVISHQDGTASLVIPDMVLPSTVQLWLLLCFSLGAFPLIGLPFFYAYLQRRIQSQSTQQLTWFCEQIR